MIRLPLDKLTLSETEQLTRSFNDRQAVRELVQSATADTHSNRRQMAGIARAALTGSVDARTVLESCGTPVPINILALVRTLLAKQSGAASLQARAANTSDAIRRDISGNQLFVVDDEDGTFLIIELDIPLRTNPPSKLTMLCLDGSLHELELVDPIEDVIQIGIAKSSEMHRTILAALNAPETSLFLQ